MKHSPLVYLLGLILLISGCDSIEIGGGGYPPAMDWRLAPLAEAKFPTAAPDSFNVVAYVIMKFVCPENYNCFGGNYMRLSERMVRGDIDWENSVHLFATPRDVRVGERYLFSLRITSADYGPEFRLRLAGYDHYTGIN